MGRGDSVSTVTSLQAARPEKWSSVPSEAVSTPILGLVQPRIRRISESVSQRVKIPGPKVDYYLNLMPRLRIRGAIPLLSHKCAMREA
jgi:hypothetical protein